MTPFLTPSDGVIVHNGRRLLGLKVTEGHAKGAAAAARSNPTVAYPTRPGDCVMQLFEQQLSLSELYNAFSDVAVIAKKGFDSAVRA